MAPEAPGNLIVVDSRFQDQELTGYVESVEYAPEQRERIEATGGWFYVLWNEKPKEADYVSLGGGVVYVNKKELPSGYKISPKNPIVLDPLGDGRYAYSYPALGEGLMFVLVLPEGHTLADSRPMPRSAKVLNQKRLAAYWKPDGKYGAPVKIVWQIKKVDGDLKSERNRINADAEKPVNVPDNQGVIVGQPDRREGTPSTPSKSFWTTIPGILTGIAAVITATTALYVAIHPRTKDGTPSTEQTARSSGRDSVTCSNLRSTDGGQKSKVRFKNLSKAKVIVYWFDKNGAETNYGEIAPTGTLDEESFVGHCWCIRNAADGKDMKAVTLTSQDQEVLIRDSD